MDGQCTGFYLSKLEQLEQLALQIKNELLKP